MAQNENHVAVVEDYAAETVDAIENLENVAVQNQKTIQHFMTTNNDITRNLMEAN